jgi:glycosyltransferase involved in cell wall biosynthesis
MNNTGPRRIGYMLADPALDLSRHEDSRVHSERVVRGLRDLGHEVCFLAAQSGEVVLTDTGYGLQQFFEAARRGGGNGDRSSFHSTPVSSLLLQFAQRHQLPVSLLATSNLAFCAARRVFRGCHLIHSRLSPVDVGAVLSARELKIPLVVEVDAPAPAEVAESPTGALEGFERLARVSLSQALCDADAIVTLSGIVRDQLISQWAVKPERVAVLRSAGEAPRPAPPDRIAHLRREYQLGSGPIVLFALGAKPWEGVELLLESLVLVRAAYPEVIFVAASEAPVPGQVRERAASLEVAASVRFLGGLSPEHLSSLVDAAEVAVAPPAGPSFELPLSRTIVHYMAAGKAIVASRSEQAAELLTHDQTAILVKPGSRDELARAIGRLLAEGELRTRLGERARTEAEREHSWSIHVRELAKVYESVLSSRRPSWTE